MELLFGGLVLGFVLSTALFIQKIWSLQERLAEEKFKAKFYREKCVKQSKEKIEWERAKLDAQRGSYSR